MEALRIKGGVPLKGTLPLSGSKNAVLPLMALSLLTKEPVILTHVPRLRDVQTFQRLLTHLGATCKFCAKDNSFSLQVPQFNSAEAPYDIVREMRASILVLGPLLARNGYARVSMPGGCAIGTRPIDFHLEGLKALGASYTLDQGYVTAKAEKGLIGGSYTFPRPTVTGSQNLLMAASLAHGTTRLYGLAQEPEVMQTLRSLQKMGAKIELDSHNAVIEGRPSLQGLQDTVPFDRIEAGTYMMASAITGGDLWFPHPHLFDSLAHVITVLQSMGVEFNPSAEGLRVRGPDRLQSGEVRTQEYPGFPTDLQAQIIALFTVALGRSAVTETIFENRFMHVPELCRMGAKIQVKGQTAHIEGQESLTGAHVMATDLRASVSLVLAGLKAQGETYVHRLYHLDRGYENLVEKLQTCGAHIHRLPLS